MRSFLHKQTEESLRAAGMDPDTYTTLWETAIYPVCESRYEAVQTALIIYRMAKGTASPDEIRRWKNSPKMSLCQSFNEADTEALYERLHELENRILFLSEELVRAGVLPEDYDFEAHKELVPMQPGDVPVTYADTSALERDFGFKPSTTLRTGLRKFAKWYREFYM